MGELFSNQRALCASLHFGDQQAWRKWSAAPRWRRHHKWVGWQTKGGTSVRRKTAERREMEEEGSPEPRKRLAKVNKNMGLDLLLLLLLTGASAASPSSSSSPSPSSDCKSYDERPKGAGRSVQTDRKVVCSNMELHQVLPPHSIPNRTVTLWVRTRRDALCALSEYQIPDLKHMCELIWCHQLKLPVQYPPPVIYIAWQAVNLRAACVCSMSATHQASTAAHCAGGNVSPV